MAENRNLNVVNFNSESFKVKESKSNKVGLTIEGFALPFDKTSRNGFAYRKESVIKTAETLKGKPMFFNHNIESLPIGRVTNVEVGEKGLNYVAELFPYTEEEKAIAEKVKAGLLDSVSIQCVYENAEVNKETGDFTVDVKEFLELSIVGVPGFADTTIMAHEKLKTDLDIKMKLKKLKEEIQETPDEDKQETSDMEKLMAQMDEIMSRLGVLESRMDAYDEANSEEGEGEDETSDSDKAEDNEEDKSEESEDESSDKEDEVEERVTAPVFKKEGFDFRKAREKRLLM